MAFLAPFRQRSFRFQWPADLATSWAIEMEMLILGWFVLTETGSAAWLGAFAALQYIGTLVSPLFGVMADRTGLRRVLIRMRAFYAAIAGMMALLAFADLLGVGAVFVLALLNGLVRPSDMGMRNALVGATMPAPYLTAALGIERTSVDMARITGALAGAGLVVLFGIGPAYLGVLALYLASLLLMLGVAEPGPPRLPSRRLGLAAVRDDLRAGFAHVWDTPPLLAAMCLAFLANFVAFPVTGGLLPHVARDVYGLDQTGLGKLIASSASGALLGAMLLVARPAAFPPGRTMMISALIWFALLILLAVQRTPLTGAVLLFLIGLVQSFCMVPMSVLLLRVSLPAFRSRVMGVRILAVYGLGLGLLATGPMVERIGFTPTVTLFAGTGFVATLLILLRWRRSLWAAGAPANAQQPP
jgi:predicted MFS family arabinose efflux permease